MVDFTQRLARLEQSEQSGQPRARRDDLRFRSFFCWSVLLHRPWCWLPKWTIRTAAATLLTFCHRTWCVVDVIRRSLDRVVLALLRFLAWPELWQLVWTRPWLFCHRNPLQWAPDSARFWINRLTRNHGCDSFWSHQLCTYCEASMTSKHNLGFPRIFGTFVRSPANRVGFVSSCFAPRISKIMFLIVWIFWKK